jgi:hypothetical protein
MMTAMPGLHGNRGPGGQDLSEQDKMAAARRNNPRGRSSSIVPGALVELAERLQGMAPKVSKKIAAMASIADDEIGEEGNASDGSSESSESSNSGSGSDSDGSDDESERKNEQSGSFHSGGTFFLPEAPEVIPRRRSSTGLQRQRSNSFVQRTESSELEKHLRRVEVRCLPQ